MGVGIVLAEVEDVADVRAAETVDRLVVVADDRDVAVLGREQVDERVLRAVGVLVLVDEHVTEAIAPLGQRLLVGPVQLDQLHDQVVEVEAPRAPQHLLVGVVDAPKDLVAVASVRDVLGPPQLALGLGDRLAEGWDRVALGVEPQLIEDAFESRARVVLVEDDKARRDAHPLRLAAQDAHRGPVEGADPHLLRLFADEHLDPRAHLPGSLVGERHREQAVRPDSPRGDQVGDPRGQDTRLSAACTREDQERSVAVRDGFLLGRIEVGEQCVDARLLGRFRHHGDSSLTVAGNAPLERYAPRGFGSRDRSRHARSAALRAGEGPQLISRPRRRAREGD